MLAAVSGLSYALATTMHLEGYLGYFLPLPVVLAAMRGGPSAGRKTVTSTFFLLLGAGRRSGCGRVPLSHAPASPHCAGIGPARVQSCACGGRTGGGGGEAAWKLSLELAISDSDRS